MMRSRLPIGIQPCREIREEGFLFAGRVYLFEFKVQEQAGEGAALAHLRERRCADKYRDIGEPIHLVGVEFSADDRSVAAFAAEPA